MSLTESIKFKITKFLNERIFPNMLIYETNRSGYQIGEICWNWSNWEVCF